MQALTPNQRQAKSLRGCHRSNCNLLSVCDLSVTFQLAYAQEARVLRRVSFSVAPGEIVAVLGESGSGKTTTALALMQLLPPTARVVSGSIVLHGENLSSMGERRLREIRGAEMSIIYQDSDVLNPVLRVGEQIVEVLHAHVSLTSQQMRETVYSALTSLGFGDCERVFHAYPHQLSGGQKRRIAIAQALVCKPRLVIADEPTAWLDCDTGDEILKLFLHMREQHRTAFLLISHDPKVLLLADRALVMYAGQIIESGSVQNILKEPKHPYTSAWLECCNQTGNEPTAGDVRFRFPSIAGSAPDPSEAIAGCSFSSRCRERVQICDQRQPELIEISDVRSVRCFNYGGGD